MHKAWVMAAGLVLACGGDGTPPAVDGGVDAGPVDFGDPSTLGAYAKACKAALGALPLTWNCQDGSLLTVDGATTCSAPPWLSLDGPHQCVNGARLLALSTDNPQTDVRVVCRRYVQRTDFTDNKIYEDVAVVASNRVTGDTCFFQALASAQTSKQLDGTKVPSPMADPQSSNAAEKAQGLAAQTFWLAPSKLSHDALICGSCHDNDPWMHTPYVDQLSDKNAVPQLDGLTRVTDRWTGNAIKTPYPYQLISGDYLHSLGWPSPLAIRTANVKDGNGAVAPQECTRCHRISSVDSNTGQQWIDWSTDGKNFIPEITQTLDWTQYRYMPEEDINTVETGWHANWDNHIKALKCCAAHPTYLGCASYSILGVKAGDVAVKGTDTHKCIDDTGQVSLNTMIGSPAVGGRAAGDTDCQTHATTQLCVNLKITHTTMGADPTEITSMDITQDQSGKPLGFCVPDNSAYDSTYPVYPGDVVTLTLSGGTAWDASNAPLAFTSWANGTQCPCEDPTSTTCRFTTKGASDWFGNNPDGPQFAGDPAAFSCAPQFASNGTCTYCIHTAGVGNPFSTFCSDASQCCPDYANEQCVLGSCCVPFGSACVSPDDCCYTGAEINCLGNKCCGWREAACGGASDCCVGWNCDQVEGATGTECCLPDGAPCDPPGVGDTGVVSSWCCGKDVCFIPSGATQGTCTCAPTGSYCDGVHGDVFPDQCCSGVCSGSQCT